MSAGTTPSTVRSLSSAKHTTTGCRCPGTRVTLVIGSVDTTAWSSAHMTVTTTSGQALPTTGTTVQCGAAADAGSRTATAVSTMLAVVDKASTGRCHSRCRHHACG